MFHNRILSFSFSMCSKLKCLPLRVRVRVSFFCSLVFNTKEANKNTLTIPYSYSRNVENESYHFLNNGLLKHQRECAVHIYQRACILKHTKDQSAESMRNFLVPLFVLFFLKIERIERQIICTIVLLFRRNTVAKSVVQ